MRKILVVAFALLLIAPLAEAGDFYVGASFLDAGLEVDFEESVDEFDEDDSGFKIWGGYHFSKFFGIEGGYYDLGEPGDELPILGDLDLEVTSWNVAAKGRLPIGKRIELFAKAGAFLWDIEIGGTSIDDDDDGTDFGYGAGISVLLSKIELRAEYEIVEFDDADLDIISVGAAWRF